MNWIKRLFGADAKSNAVDSSENVPSRGSEGPREFNEFERFHIASAENYVRQINESLQLADKSHEADTRVSRLAFAKKRLDELKSLAKANPYIVLERLDQVESSIALLELRELQSGSKVAAEGNQRGIDLEKQDATDLAIAQYESLVLLGVDTPHTYRRLAIIYRRLKRPDDERRVLEAALKNVPNANGTHHAWFAERLAKVGALRSSGT